MDSTDSDLNEIRWLVANIPCSDPYCSGLRDHLEILLAKTMLALGPIRMNSYNKFLDEHPSVKNAVKMDLLTALGLNQPKELGFKRRQM